MCCATGPAGPTDRDVTCTGRTYHRYPGKCRAAGAGFGDVEPRAGGPLLPRGMQGDGSAGRRPSATPVTGRVVGGGQAVPGGPVLGAPLDLVPMVLERRHRGVAVDP